MRARTAPGRLGLVATDPVTIDSKSETTASRSKPNYRLVERIAPALKHFAEAYDEWSSWTPPTDRKMQYQFRDKVKIRLTVPARLAIQAVRAKEPDEEPKEEMSMLKYALDGGQSEVKAEQVAPLASKMEDLKNTKCRIATLEAQVGELEYYIEDTKTALAETEAKIAADLHDIIHEPAGAEMAGSSRNQAIGAP
ncbi:unnamed protein product [Prorocentrum cordatum]|uniref:Uncharacterized protein n=1 Tax=Prorocentrum cordatum TaxID=2364126 RepID=A0ABN9PUC2_9DINO|nr:unnamed protein product [Polarella glacialis]